MNNTQNTHGGGRHFKQALRGRTPLLGLWSGLCSPIAVEILAEAGFDWIVLDGEHAPMDVSGTVGLLQAMKGGTATPVVRVPWNDPVTIKRFLDIGAETLLVPFIETADQARAAVTAMRYPPEGIRGVAGRHRASRYGRCVNYLQEANDGLCLIVQIESAKALSNLAEIVAVDGVDGVFIGPSDLAASLGFLGRPDHATVQDRIGEALAACQRASMPAGILAPEIARARHFLTQGFSFVAAGIDVGLLVEGSDRLVRELKTPADA